jgi:hypothetical protein
VDQANQVILLMVAVGILAVSTLTMLRRQRVDREKLTRESPFATSTEGEKRCPNCGMGNLWTDRNCISCKARLPG